MNNSVEKVVSRYVICSIDQAGKTVYLNSLRLGNWEITTDIERASKAVDKETAQYLLEGYYSDMKICDEEWAVIPLVITYTLVGE